VEKIYEAGRDGTFGHESADALTLRQLGDRYFTKYVSPKTGRQLGRNERYRWNVMIETKVLDHANISTSSRYLKPSKLALHTTIQRIDAQRRASGEAAKWEQEVAKLQKNLLGGPQKGPQAGRIVRRNEAGKSVTPPRINRLGA
jgi:hypothetical protein